MDGQRMFFDNAGTYSLITVPSGSKSLPEICRIPNMPIMGVIIYTHVYITSQQGGK